MIFTHVDRKRRSADTAPYSWSDRCIPSPVNSKVVRRAYRLLRQAGTSETEARGLIWDLMSIAQPLRSHVRDHDTPPHHHSTNSFGHFTTTSNDRSTRNV